ncbi:MAG: AbrB/MazE/SpoVT family DNA-binding domain-containing protein, partial [Oscillospiraceae bacterium]|jgi:antitoxin MazE|nr:AbrB/MazE/SpoVT family DNA-binding domain-containing protein [Oscillospiraceae bacterium]
MVLSQVSKWGNSQGIRIPRKLLHSIGIDVTDEVEIIAKKNLLIIKPMKSKTIDWYLESYTGELNRYDWGDLDEPKGRELI